MANIKPHIYEVGEVVNGLKIVEQRRIQQRGRTRKGYLVESLAYPDAPPYETEEHNLKKGIGCAYVSSRRIFEGNSLYSHKEIRDNLIDVEQAKTISQSYGKEKILFKCENDGCDHTKMMRVHTLVEQGFTCPCCSTGTSYPERFMTSYLIVKNIPHETQVKYEELELRRYDFRIEINGVIFLLETHGLQHYEETGFMNHKRTVKSDNIKRQYAHENNINYIELDCRKSDFNFIKQQIELNEYLPNINDDELDEILELMEVSSKYPVKEIKHMYLVDKLSTYKIADEFGIPTNTITNILKRNNIKLRGSGQKKKKVRCIETGVIYSSGLDAKRKTGILNTAISNVCIGNAITAGGYHWEYVVDTGG